MYISDEASGVLAGLAETYVREFPNYRAWSFAFGPDATKGVNELVALGLLERWAGKLRLTGSGQRWIMDHRPDLEDEDDQWSDEVDTLRDTLTAEYEEAGFPSYQTWWFHRGNEGRVYSELTALGLIEHHGTRGGAGGLRAP
jgi:hypothetical protein